jgi:hypothetical protein
VEASLVLKLSDQRFEFFLVLTILSWRPLDHVREVFDKMCEIIRRLLGLSFVAVILLVVLLAPIRGFAVISCFLT